MQYKERGRKIRLTPHRNHQETKTGCGSRQVRATARAKIDDDTYKMGKLNTIMSVV